MKSKKLGKSISKAEVLSISPFGLWVMVLDKEYFLSSKELPWFHSAKIDQDLNIHIENKNHLRWDDLDIDLDLSSLDKLEQYPLIAR